MSHQEKKAMAGPQSQPTSVAAPTTPRPRHLPRYKVILHNDDVNDVDYVIATLLMLTPLSKEEAKRCTEEADKTGVSLIIVVHRERAELYAEQFQSRKLTVTIEPAE